MKTSKATPGKHDGKEGRGLSSAKKKAVLFVSFALVLAAFLGAGMLGNGGGDSGSDKAVIGAPGDLDVSPWADIIREIGPVTLGTGEFELQPGLIYEIELAGGAGQPGYDGAGGGDGGSGGNGAVVWFWVDMRGETLARTFTFYVFGGGQGGDRDGDGGYGGDGGSA
ncbi:MAG: hypothetical protein FWH44_05630, partial [Methanomassiliicoccaceae archaeon]|nr:hypothetical protein [Methanomassiliicoccaceae archaeon]